MADSKQLTLGTLFKADITDFKNKLAQIESAIKKAAGVTQKIATSTGKATTATTKATAATKQATAQYAGFTKQISKVHGGLERVKAAFKVTASYGIAATAIYMVINAFKVGAQAIIDYDQALKNLQAITGATGAEVSAMGETIKDVARTTKFSTSEVAEGMVLLGQAGFDAGESMDAMQATANLATGTLSDMRLTTDLLTTTIRAFNLDTMEAGRVSDVMANAINKSKLTIDKLRISFNYIGATAAQAGVSLEETAATMMTLANNGLRASTIGTGMRQVLSRLIAPNAKLREAYEAHGVALDQVNPKTVGYQKVLENLTSILFDSETNAVNMAKAFELFGLRGAQAAAILVKGYVGGEFQVALNNVYEVGTAAEMSGIQQEGLGVQFKNLADRAKLVAVALGEGGVGGALGVLVDILVGVTVVFEAFATSAVGGVITKVTLLVATFAGLSLVLKLLVSSFKGLLILKVITSNFVLLTTGLGAATAGFAVMTGVLGKLRAAMTVLWALIAAHPFTAIATAIATLLIALDQLAGANEKVAKKLSVASVEAKRMAEGINLYADSLAALDRDSREHQSVLERFGETYPEITREVLKMTKAIDLADVPTNELVEAMKELAAQKAWESLKKSEEASKKYREELIRTEVQFLRISELWPMFYHNLLGIGEAYDRNAKLQKTLNEEYDNEIQALKTLVKVGKMTIDQALERIDAMDKEKDAIEDLKDAFVNHFNRIAFAGNEAVDQIKDVFAELPLFFEQLYNQLDASRQALFVKMIDSMQREVAAHRKRGEDMGIAEHKLQDQIEAIRQMAFDKFVEGMEKEVEAKKKALEKIAKEEERAEKKRLKAREKLLDQLKSLEEKLQEDLKILRQEDYTIEEKFNEDMKGAREALADARKAINKAETKAQKEAAIEDLNTAREKYRAILDMAKSAEEAKTKITKEGTQATLDIGREQIDWWKKRYEEMGTQVTSFTSTVIEGEKKKKEAAKETTDAIKKEVEKALLEIQTLGEGIRLELAEEKPINITVDKALESLDFLDQALDATEVKAAKEKPVKLIVKEALEKLNSVLNRFRELVDTKWESTHEVIIKGLKAFERVKYLHDTQDGRHTHSHHTVHVKYESSGSKQGSGTKSLGAGTAGISNGPSATYSVAFQGSGSTTKSLGEKIQEVEGWFRSLGENISVRREYAVDFKGAGSSTMGLLDKLQQLIDKVSELASTFGNIGESAKRAMTVVSQMVGYLGIKFTYIDTETGRVKYSHTFYAQGGGPVPGYGGGDKVPSMLERGEFVIKKEAVAKYGAGFFDKLNSMISPQPAMQSVAAAGPTFNITFAPQVMTGDKLAMRTAAMEFKKAIGELDHQWGTA